MKRISLAAMAAVAAFVVASPASATICIGIAVNGGAVVNVGCDGGTGSLNYNTTSGGYFFNVSATGSPLLAQPLLQTQSVNIQNQGGADAIIDVYVSQTSLGAFTGSLLSSFTSSSQSGVTAQLLSAYDTGGNLFSGSILQSRVFNPSAVVQTFAGSNNLGTLTSAWSETVRYRLTFFGGNGSNFNGMINLSPVSATGAVPEPATWGMMLLGFGGMGYTMRRKNKVSTRIKFA